MTTIREQIIKNTKEVYKIEEFPNGYLINEVIDIAIEVFENMINEKIQEHQDRIDRTNINYDLYIVRELKTYQNCLRELKEALLRK